jgi:hypothetical protein
MTAGKSPSAGSPALLWAYRARNGAARSGGGGTGLWTKCPATEACSFRNGASFGPLDEEGRPFLMTVASPWLADRGLIQCDEPGYPARTRVNVRDSDATLRFGDWHSPGGTLTLDTCRKLGKPFLIVYKAIRPSEVSD